MKARRITEIIFETDETITIRRSSGSMRAPCPQCGSLVDLITPEEAALLLRAGVQDIFREVEAGYIHAEKSASGSVLLCLESLQKAAPRLLPGNSELQINQVKENPS